MARREKDLGLVHQLFRPQMAKQENKILSQLYVVITTTIKVSIFNGQKSVILLV